MHIFVISLHQIGGNKNSRTEKMDKKNNSKLDSGRGGKEEEKRIDERSGKEDEMRMMRKRR